MNRDKLIERLKLILEPLEKNYSSIGSFGEHASCYGETISWFEMFCRSSYGIIAYSQSTRDFKYVHSFSETLLKVINDDKYMNFADFDQKAVELVPVATLLLIFRRETWDTYSEKQKVSLISYFENIINIKLCANNWVLFKILVCTVLNKLTDKSYDHLIENAWAFIDKCYLGEGWYRDGINGTIDYYNAFGFHFYSLLYYYLCDNETERTVLVRERALLFAHQYKWFFDDKGRSIALGRSLIYRYGILSFWSMMLVNRLLNGELEKEAVAIISANLQWWNRQNIYNNNGYQTLGYIYPNKYMLEDYNSSGSVYWSLKSFLLLLADENSSLWERNNSLTRLTENSNHRLAKGNIIISATQYGNIAYLNPYHGSGQRQDFAKYMHFSYHSATGFNICKCLTNFEELSDDSSLIFKVNGQKLFRSRNIVYKNRNQFVQECIWRAGENIKVFTSIIPLGAYHLRVHIIASKIKCESYETGFAIKKEDALCFTTTNSAVVYNSQFRSSINNLLGGGTAIVVLNEANSNIYEKETIMPVIKTSIDKGKTVIADLIGLDGSNVTETEVETFLQSSIKVSESSIIVRHDKNTYLIKTRCDFFLDLYSKYIEKREKTICFLFKLAKLAKMCLKKYNKS